jgi:Xaa-Pro aminopeptidase
MKAGELVLVDGGAEVDLYAGDVSRTFPSGGRFSDPQRALYEVVVEAHQRAVEAVRPGRTIGDIHGLVQRVLTGGLVALGVLEGDVEELVEGKAFERYFPHQTSHWLGLDVHDVGDYAREGSSRVLEPGMVLTIEPGLYFSPRPEEVPGPFSGLGIRVEDDILVTEEGAENLTEALPVFPDEVEELVGAHLD